MKRRPMAERFWKKVQKEPNSGCWLWTGAVSKGYGHMRADDQGMIGAHRASWVIHCGEIPDGIGVLHHCDTPLCVNPRHLFLGTPQDNSDDASMKGRMRRGDNHPSSVLCAGYVQEIRALRRHGWSQESIAERFGVSQTTISLIDRGLVWKSV